MREIKFRAWDKNKKAMVMAGAITFNANGKFDGELIVDNEEWLQVEKFELMQYTGLKDKNGKEIYEGDIVKCSYPKKYHIAEVKHDEVNPCFMMERYDRGYSCDVEYDFVKCDMQKLEVIGNIYENKNLLINKEKK